MDPVVQAGTRDESPSSEDEIATVRESATDRTAPDKDRPPPSALGRYSIEAVLGRGMMGVLYRAMDPVLDRKVALKVIELACPVREEEQGLVEQRFLAEARLAARLTHPDIVAVYDMGWDAEARTPFMAFEYLEGRTLAEVLANGPAMDWSEALRLVSRLAGALHYAHGHGVVHLDIKPANIMILPSGDPKIMDFGIAKASAAALAPASERWGTPSYMSPEQACGRSLDGRTDLFSLGSVLYQLLTGHRPFEGKSATQTMNHVVNHEPLLPSRIKPALPRDLDVVIARALAKDPEQRYSNGQAFAEDLQDVLHSRPLRDRDGLKTPPVIESKGGYLPADVVAAPALLMTHALARPRRLMHSALLAVGAGLVIGIALLGFRHTTGAKASAVSDAPLATAALGLPVASAPAPPARSVPPPTARPTARRPRRSEPTVAAPEPSPLPPTVPPAHLALSVKHSEKQGRFRVWIDGQLVLETELVGSGTWHSLVLTEDQGAQAEAFGVAPGDRLVRVEVEEDGQRRSAGISGAFESSQTRLLEVKLGGNVGLKWKS